MKLPLSALLVSTIAVSAAPLAVTDAWFRSLPGKLPAGGYFTAVNNTRQDVDITGAQSAGCGMLMLHQSQNKGGMSGMDMVEKATIPAGGMLRFAPGGYHLMCENPKLKIGARVPVVINLSNGSAVAVAFLVRNAKGK